MQSLDKLLSIDKNFQTAVNLRLDRKDSRKFRGYLPTTSSAALLKQLLENIVKKQGKGASVMIGPYGKGKSHLLLMLLALLEGNFKEEQEEVLKRLGRLDAACVEAARKVLAKGPYLTILISDNGGSLNTSFLLALKEALDRKNISALMPESYYSEAVLTIEKWRAEFPQTFHRLQELLGERPGFSADEDPASLLKKKLESFDESALALFQELYPGLTSGMVFDPLIHMDAAVLYQEVNRKLCRELGYRGMYLVFDEFGKYMEGHSGTGFAADMKMLQDICELANSAVQEEFYITVVTHKSLREYNSRLPKELQNQFRGVEGRLKEYLFVDSVRNQFDLVGSVLKKTEAFDSAYEEILAAGGDRLLELSYSLPVFSAQFSESDFRERVAKGCFPLTPLAAVLLLNLCEKVAQNERTLFTFLAGNEHNSMQDAIRSRKHNRGYLGAPLLYDYFSPLFRECPDHPEIYQEWLKAEYALGQQERDSLEAQVLKTVAILQIAGNRQEFPVSVRLVSLSMGSSQRETEEAMAELTRQQLLIWRSKLGCYAFKNNIGINLEEELAETMRKLPDRMDCTAQLSEVSELEYLLPKGYNQKYAITRYFQYVFLTPEMLQAMKDPKYLFQESFADGKLIALISEETGNAEQISMLSGKWMESRIAVLLPKKGFAQKENLKKVLALQKMLGDKEFVEDNRVVEQEMKLYLEDVLFEINAALEEDFLPQNGGCYVIWQGKSYEFKKEKDFNSFLSHICAQYYAFSPRVNHELLNIQSVTGQYLRARNHVVESILKEESLSKYERGSSPEAMIYRTAFVRTGVLGSRFPTDPGTSRILQQIRAFLQKSTGQRVCFAEIYGTLQGEGYGVRRGVMPLFLALEYMRAAGTPVLYLHAKEVVVGVEIFNNINERPEEYYLYLEQVEGEKEKYLAELERFLGIRKQAGDKQHRMYLVAEGLQQRYRALPKLVSNWKQEDIGEWQEKLKELSEEMKGVWEEKDAALLQKASRQLLTSLRRVEVNARELLFEKIPGFLGKDQSDLACAKAVEVMFRIWQSKLARMKRDVADQMLLLWQGACGESLAAYLSDWYRRLGKTAEKTVFTTRASAFWQALFHVEGMANEEIIAALAKRMTGIYMEDWMPETKTEFLEAVRSAKEEMEQAAARKEDSAGQKKVIFTDGEGRLVERRFQPDESGVGIFLKNALREAMEEFGDSMDTGQKVAVLVETLEELLK